MMSLSNITKIHPINTPGVLWEVSHVELVLLQFRWKRLAQQTERNIVSVDSPRCQYHPSLVDLSVVQFIVALPADQTIRPPTDDPS